MTEELDQAIDFYSNKLGFQVKSRDHYPYVVVLEHEPNTFILSKMEKPAQIDYPNVAQTLINFQIDDLEGVLKDLKEKGVDLIHETPQNCPVGVYAALRDPLRKCDGDPGIQDGGSGLAADGSV